MLRGSDTPERREAGKTIGLKVGHVQLNAPMCEGRKNLAANGGEFFASLSSSK